MTKVPKSSLVGQVRRRWYGALPSPRSVSAAKGRQAARDAQRVLGIGCGCQAPALLALEATQAVKVGIDLVKSSKSRDGSLRIDRGTCERLPFASASFNLVMCRSVLEHCERLEAVFGEVARVLAPGVRIERNAHATFNEKGQ